MRARGHSEVRRTYRAVDRGRARHPAHDRGCGGSRAATGKADTNAPPCIRIFTGPLAWQADDAGVCSPPDLSGSRGMPGEVLVCLMTWPPGTVLFALADVAASDAGGVLSRPTVAALGCGTPCIGAWRHGRAGRAPL